MKGFAPGFEENPYFRGNYHDGRPDSRLYGMDNQAMFCRPHWNIVDRYWQQRLRDREGDLAVKSLRLRRQQPTSILPRDRRL